jgi:hypothetical protein
MRRMSRAFAALVFAAVLPTACSQTGTGIPPAPPFTIAASAIAEAPGGRLNGTLPPDPSDDRVARDGRAAQSVVVSSSVLGPLGSTRLNGSSAALDQLDACDRGTI